MIEQVLKVKGMHCHSCEVLLEEALGEIAGVKKVKADEKAGTVRVSFESAPAMQKIKAAIKKEGYSVA